MPGKHRKQNKLDEPFKNEELTPWDEDQEASITTEFEGRLASGENADIFYWDYLQDKARRKAARALENSTQLNQGLEYLDTLRKNGGVIAKYKPSSYFDVRKEQKKFVPGVGTYELKNGEKFSDKYGAASVFRSKTSIKGRELWKNEEKTSRKVPGVGQYEVGGQLSTKTLPLRSSKLSIDEIMRQRHEKMVPGAGKYFISGDISDVKIGPVLSSSMRGKNEFDLAVERGMEVPAPDAYKLPEIGKDIKGGVISTAVPPPLNRYRRSSWKTVPRTFRLHATARQCWLWNKGWYHK